MSVTLRAMRSPDIASVLRLEDALFVEDPWSKAMFSAELAERETRHYVVAIQDDGEIVGYAGLCAYGSDVAYVQTIAVDRGHQRAGVGTMLLNALVDEADLRGCDHLDLEVRADNDGAIAFYVRHGFTPIGVRRRYYQPSNTDAIVMRRERSS